MAATICPHCKHDRTLGKVVTSAGKGAAVGVCTLINPFLGAAVLTGLALQAWANADKTEIKCPNCGKFYHD